MKIIRQILRRNIRQPVFALAVVLFAAVLTVVLCHLYKTEQEEQRSLAQTYASVPVTFRITELDGSLPSQVPGWIADLFTERGMGPNLAPFVGSLHVRINFGGSYYYTKTDESGAEREILDGCVFSGIHSLRVAEELTEDWGGKVCWYDGYDESILATEEPVCLVPESRKDLQELKLRFTYNTMHNGITYDRTCEKVLKVAGYYIDEGNSNIYIPFELMDQCFSELGQPRTYCQVFAVLNDNTQLAALREAAAMWFAEPDPEGKLTEWGRFGYEYYLYALEIDDYMLQNLNTDMKNDQMLNKLASAVVFAMSAGAGFLTGFLVIRARKRDITLMRTLGASQISIFIEFSLEQVLCIAFGIVLGGWYTLWQPAQNLLLFGGIYFAGLTAALIVFLRRNLISNIKNDE